MNDNWRILVVEDDPDGQTVVTHILAYLNIAIDNAGDAEQAKAYLFGEGRRYDAVIIDLALPGKDGFTLLGEILADPATADMPCVAVTAYHTSVLREQAIGAGFSAYFPKPFDVTHFMRGLEDLLRAAG